MRTEEELRTFERFKRDTKNHSMKILLDEGIYRHLSFTDNGSSICRFDLVTVPGHLFYIGDMGSFTFNRLHDMFHFFGNPNDKEYKGEINPSYWSEKVESVDRYGNGVTVFSPTEAREILTENVTQWIEDVFSSGEYSEALLESYKKEIFYHLEEEVFHHLHDGEHDFRQALDEFSFKSEELLGDTPETFEFTDSWEYDFSVYSYRYIWCLYAITWGIFQYNKERKNEKST